MVRRIQLGLLVVAALLLSGGCGGGGNPPPVTGFELSDLEGEWSGPTGQSSTAALGVGTGSGGMLADANGGATRNGSGNAMMIALVDPDLGIFAGTYTSGAPGVKLLLIMSSSKKHLMFVDADFTLGAWQKGATGLVAPYGNTDIEDSVWVGVDTALTGSFDVEDLSRLDVIIDPVRKFTAAYRRQPPLTASSDGTPLSVIQPDGAANGQFNGDFKTEEASSTQGPILTLITPDRMFMAVQVCEGSATLVTQCRFGGWTRLSP